MQKSVYSKGKQNTGNNGIANAHKHVSKNLLSRLPSRNRIGKSKSWTEPKSERSGTLGVVDASLSLCGRNDTDTDSASASSSSNSSSSSSSFSSSGGSPCGLSRSRKPLLWSNCDDDAEEKGDGISRWRGVARLWKRYLMFLRPRVVVSRNLITNWSSWRSDPTQENEYLLNMDMDMDSGNPGNASMTLQTGGGTIWKFFTLQELHLATNNFSTENYLGKGGYAEVYKGLFAEEGVLAVKRLTRGQTQEQQRVHDFLTELGIIVHIDHPNTARLVGFCVEGGLYLVYDFFPRGSLASMLHGPKCQLMEWGIRYKVALGIAKGLRYLHQGCQRRIIHRDIKASNILLAEDFEPQISDFGLAKWLPEQLSHLMITEIEGTFGYLAPEYFMYGIVDEKTDVFAYGVVLLELISGRLPIDSLQHSLVMWAKPLLECGSFHMLVDPGLGNEYDLHELKAMAFTAWLCVQEHAASRPSMKQVVEILNGECDNNMDSSDLWKLPEKNLNLPDLEEMLGFQDYTVNSYQTDLNRHREVALDF